MDKKNSRDFPVKSIFSTLDYDKFKFLDYNRRIRKAKNLEKSIRELDLTECVPIVVNEDFYIIDGQHRFAICKELGYPIYYVIFSGDAERAMVSLNITANVWRQEEWLEYYCGKKNPTYLSLREFMGKYPRLGISNAIMLFSGGSSNTQTFKEGKLLDKNSRKEEIADFLYTVQVPYAFYRPFAHAVMSYFFSHNDRQIIKLRSKVICVPKYSSIEAFLSAFENLVK